MLSTHMNITDALALVLAEQQGLTKLDAYERYSAHMALVGQVHKTRTTVCFAKIADTRDRLVRACDIGNRTEAVREEHALRYADHLGREIDASFEAAKVEIERRFREECSATRAAYAVPPVDAPDVTGILVGAACEMPRFVPTTAPAAPRSSVETGGT